MREWGMWCPAAWQAHRSGREGMGVASVGRAPPQGRGQGALCAAATTVLEATSEHEEGALLEEGLPRPTEAFCAALGPTHGLCPLESY